MIDRDWLFLHYERIYFTQLELRESLNRRLQLPFTVFAALAGFLGYMVRGTTISAPQFLVVWFWVTYFVAIIASVFAFWFFRLSWFKDTDKLLPTPEIIEQYLSELGNTYADYPRSEKAELVSIALDDAFYRYYVECGSMNCQNNDARSYNIFRCTVALTVGIIFAVFAYVPFYLMSACVQKSAGLICELMRSWS